LSAPIGVIGLGWAALCNGLCNAGRADGILILGGVELLHPRRLGGMNEGEKKRLAGMPREQQQRRYGELREKLGIANPQLLMAAECLPKTP
jgi:hypothetical protein